MTVGELIEELSKHENDAQLEIVLEGVDTSEDKKLVIIAETDKNTFKKHLVNMTSWNMYVVEDLEGAAVNKYKYEVNYMPESIVPFTVTESK